MHKSLGGSIFRNCFLVATLFSLSELAFAVSRPFPQHTIYTAGVIKPSRVTQSVLDDEVRAAYLAWKSRYLAATGSGQFYLDVHGGVWEPSAVTVSEAHGYAMTIVALMAGYDPDAKTIFDGLLRFARAHPSCANPNLMAWYEKRSGKAIVTGECYNATDGDLDIGFALLLADRQWGSAGAVDYKNEAKSVINASMQYTTNRKYWFVLRGDTGQDDMSSRTSDYMIDHFRSFANVTGGRTWPAVVDRSLAILASIQSTNSPVAGLVPDFVVRADSIPVPAKDNEFEGGSNGSYSYNACRVPLRLGIDYMLAGDTRDKAIVGKITTFMKLVTGGDVDQLVDGYHLDGTLIGTYSAMAFIAPLAVSATVDASNQVWLDDLWQKMMVEPIGADYFGDDLKLLSMISISGNYWAP